jgi:uncharacterized repeat protein (TIGR03833 family)
MPQRKFDRKFGHAFPTSLSTAKSADVKKGSATQQTAKQRAQSPRKLRRPLSSSRVARLRFSDTWSPFDSTAPFCYADGSIVNKENNSNGILTHNPFAGLARVAASVAAAPGRRSPEVGPREDAELPSKRAVFPEKVTLRQETKGRHGKTVTRVTGLALVDLSALASRLKKALGCGAIVEDGDLLLLGAVEERAADWFRKAGATRIVSSCGTTVHVAAGEPKSNMLPLPERTAFVESASGEPGGNKRSELRRGQRVAIVLKADQPTGKLTEGVIESILTNSTSHPHGIKVRLESGQVGRVKRIVRD